MKKVVLMVMAAALAVCMAGCSESSDSASSSASASSSSSSSGSISSSSSSSSASAVSSSSSSSSTATPAKSKVAELFGSPVMATNKMGGQVGIFHASTEKCTPENLAIWYSDYVAKYPHSWDVILYTNKQGYGVYAAAGMVETNVALTKESDGTYTVSDSSEETLYIYDSDSKSLMEMS